jgi:hypothetical protein
MKAIAFVKEKGTEYTDLHGRRLVDSAITIIVGHLFLGQATKNDRKNAVAKRFLDTRLPQLRADIDRVLSGDRTAIDEYATLAGPLPAQ